MSTLATTVKVDAREPVLDSATIERYRQRRESLLKMLVDAFLEEGPRYFKDLRRAIEKGDCNGARMAAHGLKSCSFNIGALRLARACQEAENVASANDSAALIPAFSPVGPALFDTEEALKSIRLGLKPR